MQQGHTATSLEHELSLMQDGAEFVKDQERLGSGADQVDTSWNGVANGLGFVGIVGFGLEF
ncbi:hypothetical protein F2Q69_00016548 [Brassica cretica]|uniref:Uncharacterized protein n=1 Tax=Brassica cretica TaxID=69181 RepID=A0A8S9R515_BRACR|nr:hypothetical protein F2Q69_00016548 [Brassica cretica]